MDQSPESTRQKGQMDCQLRPYTLQISLGFRKKMVQYFKTLQWIKNRTHGQKQVQFHHSQTPKQVKQGFREKTVFEDIGHSLSETREIGSECLE